MHENLVQIRVYVITKPNDLQQIGQLEEIKKVRIYIS